MQPKLNFLTKDYLPNSEERIEHLRKIVDGRPVAILAAGTSINKLEKRISELAQADICYFSLNSLVQETHILQQINKQISVLWCSGREGIPRFMKDIINFLDRAEDNMFVSSFWRNTFELMDSDFDLNQFLSNYDKKLIFFSLNYARTVPNSNKPLHFIVSNSLLGLIQIAIIGNASKILLFGADGGCERDVKEWYYRQSDSGRRGAAMGEYIVGPKANLRNDTNRYFNPIAPIAIRNIYKTYNLAPIDILNCSEKSSYTSFPIISYDHAFEYILSGKKFRKKSDLRIPKVSVITPYLNNDKSLKATVENISNQSYSNYEHIIYGAADDEMRDMIQRFPRIRWISEKNIDYIKAIKKGISMARGDYIFHCGVGDGYLNKDWFNTCLEVLENNPDISLIWGLSQFIYKDGSLGRIANAHFFDNPPSQEKIFIYYWLKKKVLFPEGNFCVRKRVLEECFPFYDLKASDAHEAWLAFDYKFNTSGYQPYFVPIVANYCRAKSSIEGQRHSADPSTQNWMKAYCMDIEQYKRQLIRGKTVHNFRAGSCELLTDSFSRSIFLFFDIGRYIKTKLPDVCFLVIEKALFFWRTYGWDAFRVATARIWHRLLRISSQQNS